MTVNGDNPNTNIHLIEQVENYALLAMGLLLELKPKSRCQEKQAKKCTDALDEWQNGRLSLLRKVFE